MTREEFMREAEREINDCFSRQRNRLMNLVQRAWAEGKRNAEIYEDPCHDIEQRILGEAIMRDALDLLKDQKNLIDGLIEDQLKKDEEHTEMLKEKQAEIKRLKRQQPKKGHWVMKYRHRKSVKHVKGYDAYDVEREIELVEESEGYEPYCSECGAAAAESFLCFCPKCGADMRESIKRDGEQE